MAGKGWKVKMKKILFAILAALLLLACHHGAHCADMENDGQRRVLASTFPVYLFTRAVCENVPGVSVELLVPSAAGCPHDFSLRPGDMQKLAAASILVINGAGLEDFLDKPLQTLDRQPRLVNAGHDVPLLPAGEDGHDHAHAHGNPHIFAAPDTAAMMVANIANGLAEFDAANAGRYRSNASAYIGKLADLSATLRLVGEKAPNRRIALEHGALAYLAANADLEVVEIFENGSSAAELARLGKALQQEKPALLAGDSQYSSKLLATLSDETGIPFASLDTCASGPENAGPDFYLDMMKKNAQTLEVWLDRR